MDIFEELTKLKEMYDAGALNESEYELLKKDILNKHAGNAQPAAPAQNVAAPQSAPVQNPMQTAAPQQQYNGNQPMDLEKLRSDIDKWHGLAILTIFLGIIWGVIALIENSNAKKAFNQGDYATAQSKLSVNKTMLWVAIGVNVLIILFML